MWIAAGPLTILRPAGPCLCCAVPARPPARNPRPATLHAAVPHRRSPVPPCARLQVSHDKDSTTVSYLEYFDVSQPAKVAALLERAMKARR